MRCRRRGGRSRGWHGFIHSFNRAALAVCGHDPFPVVRWRWRINLVVLMGEQDAKISLLQRVVEHALNTTRYYTLVQVAMLTTSGVAPRGSGVFQHCKRGVSLSELAARPRAVQHVDTWAGVGFVRLSGATSFSVAALVRVRLISSPAGGGVAEYRRVLTNAATATADFYLTPALMACRCGIRVRQTYVACPRTISTNRLIRISKFEPVDSSAAAIAAQGLIRLGIISQRYRRQKQKGSIVRLVCQWRGRYSASRMSLPIRSIKVCCCTRCIIAEMAGDYIAPGQSAKMVKARCGAITICAIGVAHPPGRCGESTI